MTANDDRFGEKVNVSLRMDEAVVLFWYLSREVWNRGGSRLEGTFDHPAENHCLQALLQELVARLMPIGSKDNAGIEHAARKSLMQRHAEDGSDD